MQLEIKSFEPFQEACHSPETVNLHFFQHFDFALYARRSVRIVPEFVDKFLYMLSLTLLSFYFALLVLQFLRFRFLEQLVITAVAVDSLDKYIKYDQYFRYIYLVRSNHNEVVYLGMEV